MKILKFFLISVLILAISWILYKAIVPTGKISYVYDFDKKSYFISKLSPDTRVRPIVYKKQEIIGAPIYFNLNTSRKFNKAKLSIKYRYDEYKSPISFIEAGILADSLLWRYNLKPVENVIIDELSYTWSATEKDDVVLLQRKNTYNSVNRFLNNLPKANEIALYNYNLNQEYTIPGYTANNEDKEIEYALKGSYQFYTYIKNEDLYYKFIFVDLNENKDKDPIDLHLYYGEELIDTRSLEDDGITNNRTGGQRTVEFKLPNMPEGAYKIELRANDDILTKKIITKQSKLSFLNKIRIANENKSNINLYTDSKKIQALTTNPGKLQTIRIGSAELILAETYKQYSLKTVNGLNNITLAYDDIILSGDGVFSFDKNSIINTSFQKVDENLDVDAHGVNYILARYNIPREEDGWRIATINFDLNKAFLEKGNFLQGILGGGKYNFLISVPELTAEDEIDDSIEIDEIRIDLEGDSAMDLVEKIFD